MSFSPETTAADDVVVLDSPSPPRVDHPNRQTSQDVILLDNSPTSSRQPRQNEPILVDERPRKRRRRDTSAPQSTPIARPESGPSTTAPVIVVDDDDDNNIQPNNFQSPPNEDIIQPNHSTSPPPIVLSHPSINLSQSNNNHNNIMNSTSSTTNNDHHLRNRRFFSSMRERNLTIPQNNIDAEVVEMAAAGPRVLSAAASTSTPSAPGINSFNPRASSSINMRFPLTSNPTPSSNNANNQGSQDNHTPSGFATLLAAANAADQSNSYNRNSTQQNNSQNRNPSSMPSLLSFREDHNHRSLHVLRSRALRYTRGVIDTQPHNRENRNAFNLQGPSFGSAASGPSASDPFVGPASGTTPSPSIEIPSTEIGGNNVDRPTSSSYRPPAHVQNQRYGTSALFVALPQGSSSQHSNQDRNSIPILNLNTGEVLQHGNNTSNGQQTSGSGTNPYSALHFIVAPPSLNIAVAPPSEMNSTLPTAGTSSVGSIDTGDSQSTTQSQIRRRSGRRRQGPSMFLTMRSSQSRRAGGSRSQTHGVMSDTQGAGSGSNGQGSSTARNPIGAYTAAILGLDPSLGRGSNVNSGRQRSNSRQRSHHLIQLMNTSGFGPPFEIQYIHGLAGDQELDYEQLIRLDEELVREKNRANKEQINALPTANATSADKDIRCCICMCDVEEGEELRVLPCNHKYHKSCIDEWLTYNGCCPVDKKRIAPRTRRRGCNHHP